MTEPITIGVLALQGDFAAHTEAFARLGLAVREVRRAEDLAAVDGLVLPGGETTTLIKLMHAYGLWEAIRSAPGGGRPVFGTCAGLILLAERVIDPEQESLGLLPVSVRRNAYGRQVDSFAVPGQLRVPDDLQSAVPGGPILTTEFVFIRAPVITEVRPPVEILARHDGIPILVRDGRVLGGSFHPELMSDGHVARLFGAMVTQARRERLRGSKVDEHSRH